eukprot:snap_masked-scaffold_4-processed-gene-9.37-mRNA-1 protein AED:1.00 eAED:1.00 QI:0/-1/0/0/-1/1/1/0/367
MIDKEQAKEDTDAVKSDTPENQDDQDKDQSKVEKEEKGNEAVKVEKETGVESDHPEEQEKQNPITQTSTETSPVSPEPVSTPGTSLDISNATILSSKEPRNSNLPEEAAKLVHKLGGAHLLLLVASAVLLVKSSTDISELPKGRKPEELAYAVFLGVISFVLTGGHFFAERRTGLLETFPMLVMIELNLFFWTVGVIVLTFGGVYQYTGNAFFAIYIGFGLSLYIVEENVEQVQDLWNKVRLLGANLGTLFFSSIILFLSAISPCKDDCDGPEMLAVVYGIVSTFFCVFVFHLIEKIGTDLRVVLFGINFAFWVAIAFLCTFSGPFEETGSGFFACWAGLGSSLILFQKVLSVKLGTESPNNTVDIV